MPTHVIVVDRKKDFPWTAADLRIVSAKDYVAELAKRRKTSAHVINLCRDYSYLSLGYYCSLLAAARGHRVIPSVEVMLDLHWKRLLRIALPEINELVRRTFKGAPDEQSLLGFDIFFRTPSDPRLTEVARRIFELFRCPILNLELRYRNGWKVATIRPKSIRELAPEQHSAFLDALNRYTRASWPAQKRSATARYSIAVLYDPNEALPPSNPKAIERFVRVGSRLGIEVELITRSDYTRLLEFDALFLRETTALDHHTYRFAKKAHSEGMPVIDDPQSMLKCTNKIYLAEIMSMHGVPTPRTLIVDRRRIDRVENEIGFPAVVKIPDSSFSRGVWRANDDAELAKIAARALRNSDLIIVQEFVRTDFDWRIGVLDRKPLYACQYFMAKGHWQILKHGERGRITGGGFRTMPVELAPAHVVKVATKAASLIGDGLYGVDVKENSSGAYVVEVNDNPNIDAGIEDGVLKTELYQRILEWFLHRLERRTQAATNGARQNGS